MSVSAESGRSTTAAFSDLDKTIISRSSTLAFASSFRSHGLITRSEAVRSACAQLAYRLGGAGPARMKRMRAQVSALCRGWAADQGSEIVTRELGRVIVPSIYAGARELMDRHLRAGQM